MDPLIGVMVGWTVGIIMGLVWGVVIVKDRPVELVHRSGKIEPPDPWPRPPTRFYRGRVTGVIDRPSFTVVDTSDDE